MTDICEVVTIVTKNGKVDINKSDLTKDHVLFAEKKEKVKKETKRTKQ